MRSLRYGWLLVCGCCWLSLAGVVSAQYSSIATPFNGASNSYFERMGLGFSGNIGNNVFFNNGGGNGALPPFGGGNPPNGAQFGFGIHGNGFNLNFNGMAESGYDASFSSVTPSVTVPNGGTGAIFSGQVRPFVTGLVPVVGAFSPGVGFTQLPPTYTSPLVERMVRMHDELATAPVRQRGGSSTTTVSAPVRIASTADRGDLSLSEIRAQADAEASAESAEVEAYLVEARRREAAGEYGPALIDYGRAAARAQGPLKEELRAKMRELRAKRK